MKRTRPTQSDRLPMPYLQHHSRLAYLFFVCLIIGIPPSSHGGVGDWTAFTFIKDIRSILFDQDLIWLATSGGAVRVETAGEQFTVFTNTEGLSGNDVTSVVIDRNRDVWFGTLGQGLARRRHDNGAWRTFTSLDGLASERITDLLIDQNTLWVGTDDGLSVFIWGRDVDEDRETFIFSDAYRGSRGVPVAGLNDLALSATTIWAATENGVAAATRTSPNLKDPLNWSTFNTSDGLPENRVTSVAILDTVVWVGTRSGGVARFDGVFWTAVNNGLPLLEIRSLTVINGVLWAATAGEVAQFDGTAWVSVGGGAGPVGSRTVAADDGGNIWVGAARNGLGRLENGLWRFLESTGPAANIIDAIYVDRRSILWCGFNEGGVSRFDGQEWVSYTTGDGLVAEPISMIGEDPSGKKWFGSFGRGLARLDDNATADKTDDSWEQFDQNNSVFEGIPSDPGFVVVNSWDIDPSGGQWFSNFVIGAPFLSPSGQWTTFRVRAGELTNARIRDIAVSADSSVWFATDNRLSQYTPSLNTWRTYGTPDGLLSPQINAVAASTTGDVWAGTDAGIARIEPNGNLTSFGLPAGLNTGRVNTLDTDARGNLWVGSPSGLARFNPETFEWQVFTTSNSPLADPLVKSIHVDAQTGDVWIGTGRGINRFESAVLPARKVLTGVQVYPNPFIPGRGDTEVVFNKLADGSQVSILTVDGLLVRQIRPDQNIAQKLSWDGRNASGQMVAGGIYLFVITAPDGNHRAGKIAVIK